jgi:predicted dithiol-disulfide oxidoreductase (DUF899 family)
MTDHKTGTREECLAARLELLKSEKELTRRGDELARRRQELPWVRIDKEYRFETDGGSASLWLDRAPLGRNESDETGFWWRRHDEYDSNQMPTGRTLELEHQRG